ncbi:MAG: AAA family ATPase [candidate division Zixibacteria bacterium]|nr:AAA family ATPase [candidate division Zixibacteria bacterium]
MVPSNLSIMIVDADRSQRLLLRRHLDTIDGIEIAAEQGNINECLQSADANPPDVLIVELDTSNNLDKTLEAVGSLKLTHPTIAVFVNSTSNTPELIMSAMRAGAQEFLRRPVELDKLRKALEKVRILTTHTKAKTATRGKVVSVFSKRGGLGVTTLAVNLGIALSEVSEQRTALIDLDLQLGDITSFLNLTPEYDILDACGDGEEVDEMQLQSCMTLHGSGVAVLAEPGNPDASAEVSGRQVTEILDHLRSMYGYVVVDASHSFSDSTYSAFEQSDNILIVTVSTVSSIRATKKSLELFRSLGYGPDKVQIVVNRVSKADGIRVNQIEKTLDYPVFWTIPNNYRAVVDAINSGIPLVNGKRPADVGKSVIRLAEALMNGNRGEVP